jgi:hypothetical protein
MTRWLLKDNAGVIMATPERSPHHLQAVLLICIAISLAGCRDSDTGAAHVRHPYSTTFPLTENPISERGSWVGGNSAGATFASLWARGKVWRGGHLWGNVQTASGLAYGVSEPTEFGDPTAILAGKWEPVQTATATVKINKTPAGRCCHEVELRLRTTISPHSITGYEAYCSVMPSNSYCHIARWNGPNGSYWNFETGKSTIYLKDGDVIQATVTGRNPTVITLLQNGVRILQATDSGAAGGGFGAYGPWTSGNPGIGFYDNADSNWKYFGFSSFSAADDTQERTPLMK